MRVDVRVSALLIWALIWNGILCDYRPHYPGKLRYVFRNIHLSTGYGSSAVLRTAASLLVQWRSDYCGRYVGRPLWDGYLCPFVLMDLSGATLPRLCTGPITWGHYHYGIRIILYHAILRHVAV